MGYVTGKTIKSLREKRKLTQKELAEQINVSDKTISKWETEKGLPDVSVIEELAKALGVSITDLWKYYYGCWKRKFFVLRCDTACSRTGKM